MFWALLPALLVVGLLGVFLVVALIWALARRSRGGASTVLAVVLAVGVCGFLGLCVLSALVVPAARTSRTFTYTFDDSSVEVTSQLAPQPPTDPFTAPATAETPSSDALPAKAEADPADIPAWVGSGRNSNTGGVIEEEIVSGAYATPNACLAESLRKAAQRARELLQQDASRPVNWQVPHGFVQDQLIKAQHVAAVDWDAEGIELSFTDPMYRAHLLLEVTPQDRAMLQSMWESEVLGRRLTLLGAGSSFFVILLATVAGYLRLDEATRGYYSGRLKLAAIAIVAVSAAALTAFLG